MDRNQLVGIALILALLVGYQVLMPKPEPKPAQTQTQQQAKASSKAATTQKTTTQTLDSTAARSLYGDFAVAANGEARDIVVENKDVKITFSTKGGRVKQVQLKNYETYTKKPLFLIDEKSSKTLLEVQTKRGKVDLHSLYFQTAAQNTTVSGQPQRITFQLEVAPGQTVEQSYTIPAEGYTVEYDLKMNGLDNLVGNENVRFFWQDRMPQFENDLKENRQKAVINYLLQDETFDGLPEGQDSHEKAVEEPVQWFTIKHKYFLAGFVARNAPLQNATFKTLVDPADSSVVKTAVAIVNLPMGDIKTGKGNYRFYYGPNDYQLLGDVATEFDRNVYLGYAVLKPLNKYFFVPVFSMFEKVFSNYGLLIVALVVFVKLLLTPLTYKSYVSMAKMRVLQPEINEIKERVGDDMTKVQSEQMKLYQQVGVSPLSGCVPVLATMPILMALFFLFPNLIELRQKSFLWSSDLSTYDAFLKFPVSIPFLGDHLSLFTVMMTISSIAYAWYNNQNTPAQPGPVNMKAMSYIFPVMFMFVLNSFPAGLTWYYFVSNVVTITQQQIIRRFVDENKIKAVLDENRKKFATGGGAKKSKFQDMLQRTLQQAEDARKDAEEAKRRAEQRPKKK
ncbi:membrane protein insertase YidC [Arsenicibacter rosenii]|uniref:Membrane protein insertase YidC n=1 Tax=Arsenicibacter rosenii TaxID=1750698 RepID=A0A1S2VMJ1_9BACT|nr:membrane protein insertase YidC [Arsenicibacter rosenii]OIN59610.1 membrane protein insertase YidC [Arsenicibacter rosenii]